MNARVRGAAAVIAAVVTTSGCSLLIDTVYLAGDRKFDTVDHDRSPTGETREATELSARPVEGGLELSCARVTRGIDRTWSVWKTWQRRGGYDRDAYLGTALMSGLFGAVTSGVLLGLCLSDERDVDCAWTAAGAPLFADMGYGLIRRAMTQPPKLLARERSADEVALGDPLRSEAIACDELRGVALGEVSGDSPTQALRAETPEPQRLVESGARHLPLAGTHATLTATDAERWATGAGLWAIDAEGVAHAVAIDRCAALRPFAAGMTPTVRQRFDADCPLPRGATGTPGAAATSPAPTTPSAPAPSASTPAPGTSDPSSSPAAR